MKGSPSLTKLFGPSTAAVICAFGIGLAYGVTIAQNGPITARVVTYVGLALIFVGGIRLLYLFLLRDRWLGRKPPKKK